MQRTSENETLGARLKAHEPGGPRKPSLSHVAAEG
jgi:hypothetical protein